jgi:uncharacterized protein involved in exopolysaccharide biosynthesis
VAILITAAVVMLLPRRYMATSQLTPSQSSSQIRGPAGVGVLAAQFGFRVGPTGNADSPEFYAELIRSQGLLREVTRVSYRVAARDGSDDTVSVTLPQWYGIEASDPDVRLRAATARLNENLDVTTDATTGTVTVVTHASNPNLAVEINRKILDLLNEFNIEKRQSQAAAEREFVESRIQEARADLNQAEDELRSFMERNVRYEQSPTLRVEAGRLQRNVSLYQEVYTSLATLLEETKLEEVRNTPVITIVEVPADTVRPEPRRLMVWIILAVIGSGVLAVFLAFGWEFLRKQPEQHPGDVAEFRRLLREAWPFGRA